ncbi:hypothetical protein OG474_30385 [Kribbella sp. NBC_01505]|uniref:hypothetical protein n=1 Tax=Kribbella sp. NBC_01505 TaxID=2903580 RepID=UPI00386663F6
MADLTPVPPGYDASLMVVDAAISFLCDAEPGACTEIDTLEEFFLGQPLSPFELDRSHRAEGVAR